MLITDDFVLALDRPGPLSFISHAHSDHAGFKKRRVVASQETATLLGVETETPPRGVELINAGHMLGAKQLYYEGDGFSLIYSGDISLRPGLTHPPIEFKQTDILIMETTYGAPAYVFDPAEEERLIKWTTKQLDMGFSVVIGCNALGKAQELIKLFNNEGILPVLSRRIEQHSRVYTQLGVKLEWKPPENRAFVALVERQALKRDWVYELSRAYNRRFKPAFATGLVKRFRFFGERFAISDHADFNELLTYVEHIQPRLVLTTMGFAAEFRNELRARGFAAEVYRRPVNRWISAEKGRPNASKTAPTA